MTYHRQKETDSNPLLDLEAQTQCIPPRCNGVNKRGLHQETFRRIRNHSTNVAVRNDSETAGTNPSWDLEAQKDTRVATRSWKERLTTFFKRHKFSSALAAFTIITCTLCALTFSHPTFSHRRLPGKAYPDGGGDTNVATVKKWFEDAQHREDTSTEWSKENFFYRVAHNKVFRKAMGIQVIFENEHVLAMVDGTPQTIGHSLLITKTENKSIIDMGIEDAKHFHIGLKRLEKIVKEATGCAGLNIIYNIEEAAGQRTFQAFAHMVPRYTTAEKIKVLEKEIEYRKSPEGQENAGDDELQERMKYELVREHTRLKGGLKIFKLCSGEPVTVTGLEEAEHNGNGTLGKWDGEKKQWTVKLEKTGVVIDVDPYNLNPTLNEFDKVRTWDGRKGEVFKVGAVTAWFRPDDGSQDKEYPFHKLNRIELTKGDIVRTWDGTKGVVIKVLDDNVTAVFRPDGSKDATQDKEYPFHKLNKIEDDHNEKAAETEIIHSIWIGERSTQYFGGFRFAEKYRGNSECYQKDWKPMPYNGSIDELKPDYVKETLKSFWGTAEGKKAKEDTETWKREKARAQNSKKPRPLHVAKKDTTGIDTSQVIADFSEKKTKKIAEILGFEDSTKAAKACRNVIRRLKGDSSLLKKLISADDYECQQAETDIHLRGVSSGTTSIQREHIKAVRAAIYEKYKN